MGEPVHIGWLNPNSGMLHRHKFDLHPGPNWEKVYVLRAPVPEPRGRRWVERDEAVAIAPQVTRYLEERAEMGLVKYGRPLTTGDDRDPLVDLFEELADALQYCAKKLIKDRGGLPPGGGIYTNAGRNFDRAPRSHPDRVGPPT